MKRRVFGFLLGGALGLGGAYLLRRLRSKSSQVVTEEAIPLPTKPLETAETEPARSKVKFNVRSTGPRPQNTADMETKEISNGLRVTRNTEPAAATETDTVATSPRSEMFDAAFPLPQAEQTDTPVAEESSEFTQDVAGRTHDTDDKNEEDSNLAATSTTIDEEDLLAIVGIGQVYKGRLQEQGINNFAELLALSPAEIAQKTGIPQERIEREKWHEQALDFSNAIQARKAGEIVTEATTSPTTSESDDNF